MDILHCMILSVLLHMDMYSRRATVAANPARSIQTPTHSKACQIRWDRTMDFLNANNSHELDGCTSIDGHLKILDVTINGDRYYNIPPMPLSELEKLRSIKEITEFLMIQHLNVTNFTFLSNLESILGRMSDSYGSALNIISNHKLEFLGFASLKKISYGHVIIESNPNLCYLEGLRWGKIYKGIPKQIQFLKLNADNQGLCIPQNKVCDIECRNGCWGPGANMCVNCQHYRYRDECLFNCSRPMLYSEPMNKKQCFDCSPECNSSCTGERADQCDSCRNFQDGPFCVSKCSSDTKTYKYPDSAGMCQPCHANCIEGCTGPENTVGPNGCNSCKVSIANAAEDKIVACLNETQSCPSGYFSSRNPLAALNNLKGEKVCIKCHPLCEECEGRGAIDCNKCKHYRYEDRCVESCPSESHYADNVTKSCEPCHQACRR